MTKPDEGDRPGETLRRVGRGLRHLADATLHPARRALLRRRIRNRRNVTSVLFVCHGNICRSPYAAAALESSGLLRGRDIVVRSAGFVGPDRPSPAAAVAVAERHGLDLTPHRSRLLNTGVLAETDLVVVMDPAQQRMISAVSGRPPWDIVVLGDLDPKPIWRSRRGVRDPWGQDEPVFESVYTRIDRCVAALAGLLRGSGVPPAKEA